VTEEDGFWILNGIVRMIPRLYSTDVSCLVSGRNSVMRNEMTAFHAILRENLPKICDKLHLLGLPVDRLIYESITSFYAHYFASDVVLRLWDLIIFNISNKDRFEKKRALWYFMAPAFWILRER
jgi:Rab-GTPase-TBC domain